MIELFKKIYEVFETNKALFEELGMEPIKHIDRFRGQPLNPAQFEYFDLPAMFIERRVSWTKIGKSYDGRLSLGFHIVTDATWDTSNISTSNEQGLKTVMYHTLVQYLLDDLESENTSKLIRVDNEPVDTGVVIYEMLRYDCTYYDPMLTLPEYLEAMIEKLNINGKLKKTL